MTVVIALEVVPGSDAERAEIEEMVRRCSPDSLYHRFHGVVGTPGRAAALLAGPAQEVYVARESGTCVGVASVADDDQACPHIGILVEDAWQRRGVGTALIAAAACGARRRGVTALVADVLYEDRFILEMLRRIGPVTTAASNPGYTARVALAPELLDCAA
jgi:GNAT superfamily N-acetyltransferase